MEMRLSRYHLARLGGECLHVHLPYYQPVEAQRPLLTAAINAECVAVRPDRLPYTAGWVTVCDLTYFAER